jgi:hypothetical protein
MEAFLQLNGNELHDPSSFNIQKRKKKQSYTYGSFDGSIKRRKQSSEGDCFLCKYGATDEAREQHTNIKQMLKIIRSGILRIPLDMLAKDVSDFYNEYIYKIGKNGDQKLPEFTPQDVRIHIEHHITAPSIVLAVRIIRTRELLQFLENHLTKIDEDGNDEIDYKAIKCVVDLSKELSSLMNQTPQSSFMSDRFLETI